MAIGNPTNCLNPPVSNGSATTTTVVTPTTTLAAGTVAIVCGTAGADKVIASVTDSAGGNTWHVDQTGGDGTRTASYASCQIVNAIDTSHTITVTWSPTTSGSVTVFVITDTGLATSSVYDTGVIASGSGTVADSGATGNLAQANEICLGLFRNGNTQTSGTGTVGGSYTTIGTKNADLHSQLQYLIVAATTPADAAFTYVTTGPWVAGVAAYKGVASSAPVNTVAPAVTGTTTVGSVLTTTNGTWTGDVSSGYTYQWQRDNTGGGSYSNIGSATASTYTLVDADDGCNVRCVVTATGTGGSTSANSNSVGLITEAGAPTNVTPPAVTGTTTVGQTLTTTNGSWLGMGGITHTYGYQWQRDNTGGGSYSNIGGATATTHVLVDADDACNMRCVVVATNDVGPSAGTNSNSVGTVVEPAPTNSVAPVVSGSTPVGSVLSTTNGTWANMAGFNPTYTYQWTRAGVNIGGATAATYTTVSADATHAVGCTVTATNTGGSAAQASNTITVTAVVVTGNSQLGGSGGYNRKFQGFD